MTIGRNAEPTVKFVDEYSEHYRELFTDVRSFEYFKELHIGLISDIPRKSLPAIAKVVSQNDSQGLHHFVSEGDWQVERLREKRLAILKQALGGRSFVLCIDETGDKKKGATTDYTARQYIGNLGKLENGVVSVNTYGVLDNITFPLLFRIFKPEKRLKAGDVYHSKPALALELIHELRQRGFVFDLVLADRLYGESSDFITDLLKLDIHFVVAIRGNHAVWVPNGTRQRQTRWRPFERVFSDGTRQTRYISEVIFGKRTLVRYFWLTDDRINLPKETTYLVMSNLPGNVRLTLGNSYGLRTWIEYGFKHIKNELGWADYRLTDYASIERWWELVFSAYLMVSLNTPVFQTPASPLRPINTSRVVRHRFWLSEPGWKHTLNNLRLLIQPFIALFILIPWLNLVLQPQLALQLRQLIAYINTTTYP